LLYDNLAILFLDKASLHAFAGVHDNPMDANKKAEALLGD
jgi:hypothetical protein